MFIISTLPPLISDTLVTGMGEAATGEAGAVDGDAGGAPGGQPADAGAGGAAEAGTEGAPGGGSGGAPQGGADSGGGNTGTGSSLTLDATLAADSRFSTLVPLNLTFLEELWESAVHFVTLFIVSLDQNSTTDLSQGECRGSGLLHGHHPLGR